MAEDPQGALKPLLIVPGDGDTREAQILTDLD